jgi:hypothetical protein
VGLQVQLLEQDLRNGRSLVQNLLGPNILRPVS